MIVDTKNFVLLQELRKLWLFECAGEKIIIFSAKWQIQTPNLADPLYNNTSVFYLAIIIVPIHQWHVYKN